MWAYLSTFILRNRLAVLLSIGVITVFMGYKATSVQLSYEFASLLPKDDTTSIEYQRFKDLFGEDGNVLVIGVQNDHMYDLANYQAWYDLGETLRETDGIEEVVSISRLYTITKNEEKKKFEFKPLVAHRPETQAEVDSIKEAIHNLPFYEDILYRKNGATLMAITLDRNQLNSKSRITLVDNIVKHAQAFENNRNIKVHYSGLPFIRTAITAKVKKELNLFLFLAIGVTATILFLFFRSIMPVVFSMLVVIIGVVWSFGTIGLLGYKITILTGLIPPLIIVIGIPNCIFLLNTYHREYKKHGNQITGLSRVIRKIGSAILMTNVTTACGFATFSITESSVLKEFGIVASTNIMMIFLLSLLMIPTIFSYLKPPEEKHTKHLDNRRVKTFVERLILLISKRRAFVYGFTFSLLVVVVIGITKMHTTGNIVDDLPKDDPVYVDLKFFEEHFSGVMPFEVYIDTGKKKGVMQLNKMKKIEQLQKLIASYPEFSRPLSVVDVVKFSKQAYYNGNPKMFALPTGDSEMSFIAKYAPKDSAGSNPLKSFIDSTRQITRVSAQMADIGTTQIKRIRDDIRPKIDSIFDPSKYKVVLTGTSIVFLKGTDYLVNSLFVSVTLAVLLISFFMALLFRSFRMVLISLVPNMIPLLLTAALMGYLDIAIKPSTVLVFSIAFGISVDDTIHFLAKYRQELKIYDGNIKQSVLAALRDVGVSMMYTSIILFFGFGIFAASKFGGTMALGVLIAITLLIAMFSNLILLPSLLLSLDKAITSKAFREEPFIEIYDEEEDIDLNELTIHRFSGEQETSREARAGES
ncbi:MAG: MMPL family transporter [Flavobacteriales bacterium]|nr:MMPL family transporter [Flavobacteriales bacterium]MCB9446827.1 MMPL family transporter [Flavobacteriales bacterium]